MSAVKVKATEAEVQRAIKVAEEVVFMGRCHTVYSPVDYDNLYGTTTSRDGNSEGQSQYFLAIERAIVALFILGVETSEDDIEKSGAICMSNYFFAYDGDEDDEDNEEAEEEREILGGDIYRAIKKFIDIS